MDLKQLRLFNYLHLLLNQSVHILNNGHLFKEKNLIYSKQQC